MARKSITGDALDKARIDLAQLKEQWQKDHAQRINDYVPTITEQAVYDSLVKAVQDAARKNENVAAFEQRVMALGNAAVKLARTLGVLA